MKRQLLIILLVLTTLVLCLPMHGFAEDGEVYGGVSVTARTVDGERESSKFEEYREIPDGVSGKVNIGYKADRYFLDLKAKDIAEDDQYMRFRYGRYGKFKVEVIYDKIPHRFVYDARTMYTGVGSGNLMLSDTTQATLQGTAGVARANTLLSFFAGAQSADIELFRKTGKVNVDISALDPVNFRVEFRREERDGTRPFSGSHGFGHFEDIPEPIDYDTTEAKFIAEYAKRPYYLSASYQVSIFENNTNTLAWDNPFRVTDGGEAKAGLIDLAPDNDYHNITLTGSAMNLPLKSRVTATASWGWMNQDDELVPFTTNTTITDPSLAPFCTSTNASDPDCLPTGKADLEVRTSLYNLVLTSRPVNFMRAKARFRYYERDNKSHHVEIPGYVRTDASWVALAGGVYFTTEPVSYDKTTVGLDLSFDVHKSTTLSVGYKYEEMNRTSREASETQEDTYTVQVDSRPAQWLDLRASYEKAIKDGNYDVTVPFERNILANAGVIDGSSVPQLPQLRKYDEANRDRDNVQLMATIYPLEQLTMSGSVVYENNDYEDSGFGLLEDERTIFSFDADYSVSERVNLNAYYSHEKYEDNQLGRQWRATAGCIIDGDGTSDECTDPFTAVPGIYSPSNWSAMHDDRTNTFGAGVDFAIIPQKLDFKLDYLYSKTDGKIKISSDVGANNDVDSNNFVPLDFENVDDIRRQTIKAKVKYKFAKKFAIAFGYMWEKFEVEDLDNFGFTNIPLTTAGTLNGAMLLGAIPRDYETNAVYAKLSYTF